MARETFTEKKGHGEECRRRKEAGGKGDGVPVYLSVVVSVSPARVYVSLTFVHSSTATSAIVSVLVCVSPPCLRRVSRVSACGMLVYEYSATSCTRC